MSEIVIRFFVSKFKNKVAQSVKPLIRASFFFVVL
jgi:hypothetical protein